MPAPKDPKKYKEWIINLRAAQKIAQNRPEVKAGSAAAWKGDKNPSKHPEVETRRIASLKIAVNRQGAKEKKSASLRRFYQEHPEHQKEIQNRPEVKEKRSVSLRITNAKPEVHKRRSIANKEAHKRPGVKEKHRVSAKRLWQDPEYREKQLRAIFKGFNLLPNRPEKFLDKFFQRLFPNQIKYIGDGKDEDSIVGGKCPDFIFTDGQKKIIEHFGDYHHGKKRTGVPNKQHEQERINYFAGYGYQTLIIWERELKDMDILQNKLLVFMEK